MSNKAKGATATKTTSKVEKLSNAVVAPATEETANVAEGTSPEVPAAAETATTEASTAPGMVLAAQEAVAIKAAKAAEDAKIKAAAKAAAEAAKAERIAKATPIPAPAEGELVEGQKYLQTMQSPMVVFSKKTIVEGDKPSRMGGKGVQVEVQILPGTNVASVKKPGSTRIFYTILANLDTTPAPVPVPAAEVPAAEVPAETEKEEELEAATV